VQLSRERRSEAVCALVFKHCLDRLAILARPRRSAMKCPLAGETWSNRPSGLLLPGELATLVHDIRFDLKRRVRDVVLVPHQRSCGLKDVSR
jgi:hypothetical protein